MCNSQIFLQNNFENDNLLIGYLDILKRKYKPLGLRERYPVNINLGHSYINMKYNL